MHLLERRGYLARTRADRYRLSLKLFELAHMCVGCGTCEECPIVEDARRVGVLGNCFGRTLCLPANQPPSASERVDEHRVTNGVKPVMWRQLCAHLAQQDR